MRLFAILAQYSCFFFAYFFVEKLLPSCCMSVYSYCANWFMWAYITTWLLQHLHYHFFKATVSPKNKAVLITGCDSGFGNALAEILHRKGFKVYACCLDPSSSGARELAARCKNGLELIRLDVTKEESIQSAKEFVSKDIGDMDLWAIVNNAGILKGFLTELSPMKDYEDCMNVNALGMVRVTKAFLPLIRRCKGRVLNICSMAGRLTSPYLGAYSMSKYAAVAFNEALKHELRDFGIRVISVEPEFFSTSLTSNEFLSKNLDASMANIDDEIKADYGEKYIERAKYVFLTMFRHSSSKTYLVLEAMVKAITLQCPADSYRPFRNIYNRFLLCLALRGPEITKDIFIVTVLHFFGMPKPKTGLTTFGKYMTI